MYTPFTETDKTLPNGKVYHQKEGWSNTFVQIYVTHTGIHNEIRDLIRNALSEFNILSFRVSYKGNGYLVASWREGSCATQSRKEAIEASLATLKTQPALAIEAIRLEWQLNTAIVIQ